jgi:hypothetical protein
MRRVVMLLPLVALLAAPACKRETVGPPEENEVVSGCYQPLFMSATRGKVDDLKAALSKESIRHFEQDVFRPGGVLERWEDVASIYSDMKVSSFIKDVAIDGDRAVIKDQVGGTLKCIREDGSWKADLSDY